MSAHRSKKKEFHRPVGLGATPVDYYRVFLASDADYHPVRERSLSAHLAAPQPISFRAQA